MVQNLKAQEFARSYEYLISLDIETSSKGRLLDIGIWDNEGFQTFPTWKKFFDYLANIAKGYYRIRVIAHNGLNFDYVGLVLDLAKHSEEYKLALDEDLNVLTADHQVIGFIVSLGKAQISFVDTMRFFPGMSLEKVGQEFFKEGKEKHAEKYKDRMEEYKKRFRKKYYEYLKQDCHLLYRIYCTLRESINEVYQIGEMGWSSGSTSMAAFRRHLCHYKNVMIFGLERKDWKQAKASYRGGLTLYIGDGTQSERDFYEGVHNYDVVSMYPSVMRYIPVPISPVIRKKKYTQADVDDLPFGIFLCDYEQLDGRVPVIFPAKDSEDEDANYPSWTGKSVWLTTYDLLFLKDFGWFKIKDSLIFEEQMMLFETYITKLWEMRLEAKRSGNQAMSLALKILMNSLYGKFGQNPIGEKIAISCNMDYFCRRRANGDDISLASDLSFFKKYGFYLYATPEIRDSFSNQIVASLVTSAARIKLGTLYNTYRTIYCDTDSLFTQSKIDKRFLGDSMGFFESKAESLPFWCVGKKMYLYGDEMAAKGVPKREMKPEYYEAMSKGEKIRVDYRSPTPLKTALNKNIAYPNKFEDHHRTIQRGSSLNNLHILRKEAELLPVKMAYEFLQGSWLI